MKGVKIKISCLLTIFFIYTNHLLASAIPILSYTFNKHEIREDNNRLTVYPHSLTLVEDRFGNKKSAIMIHGHQSSCLSLGTSNLLKPKIGSISLCAKLNNRVYAGKGIDINPIICTKRRQGDDFYDAYILAYSGLNKRVCFNSGTDTIVQTTINANDTLQWGQWYHYVITWDHDYQSLYVNGLLQVKSHRGYDMTYLEGDSVIIGYTANPKNCRYMSGDVDDILVFDKVLTGNEVLALYNAANPSVLGQLISQLAQYGAIVLVFVLIISGIHFRNRKMLSRQKENYELQNKISELELMVIKSRMSPHFISNCLSAIQELIFTHQTEKAGQYLAKFSYFLRSVLYLSEKNFLTLSDEIQIIKTNIDLEQLRFKNQFEFQLIINENVDVNEIYIPSLITQPFIENAIWHGLLPLKSERIPKLIVHIYIEKNYLYIDIEDNGVGRSKEYSNVERPSMGTKLMTDKANSINKLMNASYLNFEIIDLFSRSGMRMGTKVSIQINIQQIAL